MCKEGQENSMRRPNLPKAPYLDALSPWHGARGSKNQSAPKSTRRLPETSMYRGKSMGKEGQENSMRGPNLPEAPYLEALSPWHGARGSKNQSAPKSTRRRPETSMYRGKSMCKEGQENSMRRPNLPKAPYLDALSPWHDARGSKKSKCSITHTEASRNLHVSWQERVQRRPRKFHG